MNLKTGAMVAAAVAVMFTGFVGCGDETEEQQQGIKCEGGNLCKGMGECRGADGKNACTGMNACAGMGYVTTETAAQCAQKMTAAMAQAQMMSAKR